MSFQSPSLAYALVFKHRARSTHHKIALSALLHLQRPDADKWRDLMLAHADLYLRGAKAPDDVFRDSMNQVFHVRDNGWGGAPDAAESWYARLVERLRAHAFEDAVYAAGVLSHYWSDPIQPLHTGQTESEGAIHRAFEQSVAKSWDALIARMPSGAPRITAPQGPGWLGAMVRDGAKQASVHYDLCIDHYNLELGAKNPPAGLDDALRDALAECLGLAIGGFAAIIDRALDDAGVLAPPVNLTLPTIVSALGIPVQVILKRAEDAEERAIIAEQLAEFAATGKVIRTLSHDDRMVRAAHARDVLKIELDALDKMPARRPGAEYGKPARVEMTPATASLGVEKPERSPAPVIVQTPPAAQAPAREPAPASHGARLALDAPVEDAPAIGPMTAVRLADIGCKTVGDLYALDPETAASQLAAAHIKAVDIRRWQAAARLYDAVRTLNQTEAHLLAAMGIDSIDALRRAEAAPLAGQIAAFAATPPGQRIVRQASPPNEAEVATWIAESRAAS